MTLSLRKQVTPSRNRSVTFAEVGDSMTLTIEVVNTGSKAGEATLRIQSVVDEGFR